MAAEGKSNLVGEGGPDGIIRRGGEGEEERHLFHAKNDTPIVEEVSLSHIVVED